MQTITFRTDKQQGPIVTAQGTIFNLLGQAIMEKNIKKNVYMCIVESLCFKTEISTKL